MAGVAQSSESREGNRGANDFSSGEIESFQYNDSICRMFVTATVVWGVIGMLAGLIVATLMVLPRFHPNVLFLLGPWAEYLTFGRLRPLHTNAAIFAFAGNGVFAAVYYSTQRLCKCRMWSDTLGLLHFWGWQLIIVAAAVTLPLGITQGKEYAEFEWPIDIAIAIVWLGFFGGNFLMTLIRRRERHMYVSLWFYIATIVTMSVLHVFNNLVVPIGWFKSYSIYAGVQDAFMQWWYGHNAVAFFLTMPFLGLMYYFLPKAAERPVFSYKLSILHFWALVFIYIWAGPHHLHYTALPEWASTLGMLFGLMLWMPSWGGMINGLLTLRGAWDKVSADPVLKFFVVGLTFYGLATLEGPMLSIKSLNALTHYTDWTIAHVHSGALGWNGMMTFGMIYWLLPRLYQTPLWSTKLAKWHFWVATIGILVYIVPIYAAGLTQGLMWRSMDEKGNLNFDFIDTLQAIVPHWTVRVLGGALFLGGMLLLAFNMFMTWLSRPATYEQPVYSAPRLLPMPMTASVSRSSSLEGKPVHELGFLVEKLSSMDWHRAWERLPVKFTVFTLLAVVAASLFEMIPMFLIRSNVPTIASVKPYTPLELVGRDIFVAEGCYNCHSQMIRPIVSETKRYGDFSKAGESIYDRPFQWGSRRIGPDLAREGGKQSSHWHWQHLENPAKMSPGSTMPHFRHLLTRDLDFDKVTDRVKAAHLLGAPYGRELTEAPDMARRQAEEVAAEIVKQGGPFKRGDTLVLNSQAVALIAYLQRLGVDLTRPAAPATEGAAPADGSAPAAGAPAATAADDSPATASQPLAASRVDTDPEPR